VNVPMPFLITAEVSPCYHNSVWLGTLCTVYLLFMARSRLLLMVPLNSIKHCAVVGDKHGHFTTRSTEL